MGHAIFRYFYSPLDLLAEKKIRIILFGLDSCGKSTIMYKLGLFNSESSVDHYGMPILETFKMKNVDFEIVSNYPCFNRRVWRNYYSGANICVFVVDSNDQQRLEEASNLLHTEIQDPNLINLKVLILATKQDLPNSVNVENLVEILRLNILQQEYFIQTCSGITGDGLYEGFDWLCQKI